MKVEQIYTGCLAQGAYYIVSGDQAAIIDPLRETKPYLDRAAKDGVKIKYIFETHFHADFVSGHIDLAKATGAPIVYGPTADPKFSAYIAQDGEQFTIGDCMLTVLHTPGHTLESSCFLLTDEEHKDYALFTGDTLFIGDVGRPDLAQKAAHMTQEELAGLLYESLQKKIIPLSDNVLVYPAHGAGSACGKHMSKETISTIGNQKKTNYALRADLTKEKFIEEVIEGLLPPPNYFPMNVKMNKEGYDAIDQVLKRGIHPLPVNDFEASANNTNALILDTRSPEIFVKGFIPNSINIGMDGSFAPWVGALIPDIKQKILLVTMPGKEEEAVTRLARVGYDHVIGYLKGGFQSWLDNKKEIDMIESASASTLAGIINDQSLQLVDVRKPDEFGTEHVSMAQNIPLDFINDHMVDFSLSKPIYIHCAGGYRSTIAASILKSRGFDNVINIDGGFNEIKKTQIPTTASIS